MSAATIFDVVPVNDLRDHEEGTGRCWCRPRVEEEDGATIVVHNSMDGRELYEDGRRKAN